MKTQKKAIKRTHSRKIVVAIIITAMAIIILISALRQQTKTPINPIKQEDPEKYFQFLDVSASGENISQNVKKIQYLFLTVKPIRGDVHNFVIYGDMIDPTETSRQIIKNGTEEHFEIKFQNPIRIIKQDNGYKINLRIRWDELWGYVTLWLKDEDIITY